MHTDNTKHKLGVVRSKAVVVLFVIHCLFLPTLSVAGSVIVPRLILVLLCST